MPAAVAVRAESAPSRRPAELREIFGVPVVSVDGTFRLLPDKPVCHGKACGCTCPRCGGRPTLAPEPARQPWQPVVIAGGLA